ncbi:MAG TPA: cyclic peptide export ABC transporter [Thermoanaerobaculia bacterium]|nr:cyclic peptide export ABC transporter [Thermoanaerobaculia bacterium]
MRLIEFVKRETDQPWTSVIATTVISGVANGCVLGLINAGASAASKESLSLRLLLLYILAIAIFMIAKKYALERTVTRVERMVRRLRARLVDRIRNTELPIIETLGRGQLYTTVGQDANIISQSAFMVTNAAQEAIMLLFAFLYVAWLSPLALLIVIAAVILGILYYTFHRRTLSSDMRRLAAKDAEFVDVLSHIVDGFKEAKLNRKKNDALFASFNDVADESERLKIHLAVRWVMEVMFSHVFFYLLVGVIVFLLPRVVPTFSNVVLEMTTAILFIIAPLEMIVNSMPMFMRANVALDGLYTLEAQLEKAPMNGHAPVAPIDGFEEIRLEGATYTYQSNEAPGGSFTIGPLDLTIRRGEMLFIVGGNGSGKSTLLKVLTGLYPLTAGTISADDRLLDWREISAYRDHISAIFTDFHLFDRLYGLEDVDERRVRALLREMELDRKTAFVDGRFTNIGLSTGQRKRLALIVALLENRDILVFDEWAADQDVHFRDYFYNSILQRLKAEGKTLIVVTHDDRYWGVSDRLIKMETGRIVSDSAAIREGGPQP